MSRKPRIYYKGSLYHVIVRGNNKQNIFKSNNMKEIYCNTPFPLRIFSIRNKHSVFCKK